MKFVIFHGSFGSHGNNWFPELKERLEALGQTVIAPQFPVEDWDRFTKAGPNAIPRNQNLANWLKFFEKEVLPQIKKKDKLCFIGHSIGSVFILHAVEKFNLQLDSAIFVSPFLDLIPDIWQYKLVNSSFRKTDFDFALLRKLIPVSYLVYGENDPYVDRKYPLKFAEKMGSLVISVKKGGHLNSEVGLFNFPLVFELCRTRLDFFPP